MATTVTVGTSARQYATLQAAWNALPATLGDDYIFELYADSEFTGGLSTPASAKTMSGRTVTIRPATGQGFRDHANRLTNPLRYNASNGVGIAAAAWMSHVIDIDVPGIILDGLQIRNTDSGAGGAVGARQSSLSTTLTVRNCILEASGTDRNVIEADYPVLTATNNVIVQRNAGGTGLKMNAGGSAKGNTIVYVGAGTSSGMGLRVEWNQATAADNAVFGFTTAFGTANGGTYHSSSDYNATDQAAIGTGVGTHNLTSLTFGDQFEAGRGTIGSEDLRVKAGASLIGAGITDGALTLDIVGQTRANPPTIGAWEFAAAGSPPDEPTIGSVTSLTHNSVTINWTDNSGDETGFKVEYGVSSGGTVSSWGAASGSPAAADAESLGISGLTPETTYRARVAATNANGDSDWVQTAEFTTDAAPPVAVKGVRVQLSAGAESLTGLSVRWWDDPTASGAPDYETDTETTDASRWLEIDLDSVTALDIDDLGYLLVIDPGANPEDDMVAAGRVPIADISE